MYSQVYNITDPLHHLDYKSHMLRSAAIAGGGYALGYGFGKLAAPGNKIKSTQKQWVTYKKTTSGGVIMVRRKNPYYGKSKATVQKGQARMAQMEKRAKAQKKANRRRGKK